MYCCCLLQNGQRSALWWVEVRWIWKGDCMFLVLPRVPEWWLVNVPCSNGLVRHMLRDFQDSFTLVRYWLDLTEQDVFWNMSDTGWAKSAWSSVFVHHMPPFDTSTVLKTLSSYPITFFCTAPTAFQMLVQDDISRALEHCLCAGEPINPEVMWKWKELTGLDIYEGYGQTETVLIAGTFKGMKIKPGSFGKASPGYDVQVVDEDGSVVPHGQEGDLGIRVKPDRPFSLFTEYTGEPERTAECFCGEFYLTSDWGMMDNEGYLWYRIGPFEVENSLIEHPAVAESAVVSSPDPVRGEVAQYIEFVDHLPKTVSGKIRRVELRKKEWGQQSS
uniref:medium-chain acyl-CoA ligase n=1 Tax=Sinocyclocheilus grahami TaxID=75366 RepID=A0A672RQQ3_SINGR